VFHAGSLRRAGRPPACFVLAVVLLAPAVVRAAEGFEAAPFRPAPDPTSNPIDVASPAPRPAGTWSAAALLDYADGAVKLDEPATGELPYLPRGRLVAQPTVLHLLGSYWILDGLELGIDAPFVLHQTGDGELGLAEPAPLEGGGPGDVRLVPKLVALDLDAGPGRIGVAVLPEVVLPTGDRELFHGGGARFSPRFAVGWEGALLKLVVNGGYTFRDEVRLLGMVVEDGFTYGVGAEVPVHPIVRVLASATHELATEATAGIGVRLGPVELLAGAAAGLTDSPLTPAWRAFGGVAFAPGGGKGLASRRSPGDDRAAPAATSPGAAADPGIGDPDGDGLAGRDDRCPWHPEDFDGFADDDGCPDPDGDGDGVTDPFDRCPLEAEDRDGYADGDGCPDDDNDGDGLADAVDRCPLDPEDRDGILDDDGCPDVDPAVAIDAVIPFAFGSADLPPEARFELARVARTILAFPDRLRVWIEGHADEVGPAGENLALSRRRALAVADFLVGQGVPRDRLSIRAHGEGSPALEGPGEEARAVNRRVEFRVAPLEGPEAPAVAETK
jgi:outer membrane protein OmpA-like peptidoglycan-associated protein